MTTNRELLIDTLAAELGVSGDLIYTFLKKNGAVIDYEMIKAYAGNGEVEFIYRKNAVLCPCCQTLVSYYYNLNFTDKSCKVCGSKDRCFYCFMDDNTDCQNCSD